AALPGSIVVGALKGPTGIGMVRLFESPPQLSGGLAITMTAVPSADVMAAKVMSGEYDAAVLPVNMAAKLYSAGIPIRLAAIVGNGMVSFLTSDPTVTALADLRGKEINVAGQGATPDYLFRRLLQTAGLDPDKDLRLSYALPYPEAAAALAAGSIRYAVLPEPFATLALMKNPSLKSPLDVAALWTKATGQSSYPMSAFVVSARLAGEAPGAVRALLDAYADSITWVTANPAAAGALVEKHDLGLPAAVAARAIPRSNYVFVTSELARPAIEALLSVFLQTAPASIGGALPDASFYATFK
ncbi:MAG TPA: ABC transporter substrate-binding protein, partial [Rectinemataceae bacterium]|nr:ABC transporter substrate-binding protein [Rectinemataceae bacterium]